MSSSAKRRAGFTPYLLLVPASVVLLVVVGWPLIQLFVISFQEFGRPQVFGAPAPFIGIDNYTKVLADPAFWNVMIRSILFCVVNVVVTMVGGTLIALLMARLNKFFRVLMSVGLLLAWAMPALTATIVWGWMFDTSYGVVNYALTNFFGLDFHAHSWLINPLSFFFVATLIIVWGAIPFVAFTVYAGLTQIPDEIMEAAQLDGARSTQRFRLITVPYLRSIFLVVTILQVIWDLRVFTQIYVLQQAGGSTRDTNLLGTYIYRLGIGGGDFGMAAAVALFMLVLTVLLTAPYIWAMLRQEED